MKKGKVFLVGAGPGDPDLITVKGRDCLKKADVVLYDRLLDSAILNLIPEGVEKIYVGKTAREKSVSQEEINQMLIEKALEGKIVVRLKGGDPFVFGRGGEEAMTLAARQIPFEIVPGISSALAVPAYSGIPVSHRDVSSSFAVIPGHEAAEKDSSSIDWENMSVGADTLIVLMSVGNLEHICARLMRFGRSPMTPTALIAYGTTSSQQTVVGKLKEIAFLAEKEQVRPPAVLVIGEVVRLRKFLRWFENKPLFGKRILVTRAHHQLASLNRLILNAGGIPVEMPLIRIEPLLDFEKFDEAIENLDRYNWIVFTSVNGVDSFFDRLYAKGLDARTFGNLDVATIGSATACALEMKGIRTEHYPDSHTSKDLLEMFRGRPLSASRILLPRANIASDELPRELRQLGAEVHELAVYRTVPENKKASQGKKLLLDGQIDVVTLTSPSTVKNLVAVFKDDIDAVNKAVIACLGPVTSEAAVNAGLHVDIIPSNNTITDLIESIEKHFLRRDIE